MSFQHLSILTSGTVKTQDVPSAPDQLPSNTYRQSVKSASPRDITPRIVTKSLWPWKRNEWLPTHYQQQHLTSCRSQPHTYGAQSNLSSLWLEDASGCWLAASFPSRDSNHYPQTWHDTLVPFSEEGLHHWTHNTVGGLSGWSLKAKTVSLCWANCWGTKLWLEHWCPPGGSGVQHQPSGH